MSESRPSLPEPGHLFEGYLIDACIAHGGTSSVFSAHDTRLDRPVALKVIAHEIGMDDKLRRFWREAQLSSRLVHPNTVRVYDYGVSEGGQPFIAFELLEGESLAKRLRRAGALSVEETRRIAVCVLKALIEAHALGIVHRDIKPANVFLCRYAGEQDFVKLLDFGIAKTSHRDLTAHGWLVGTPGYMAPEQIRGGAVGPATDVYSLGLVIATALSGSQIVSGGTAELLAEHASTEALALPQAVVKSPLHRIVRFAVEKDPAKRYGSAEAMLADLESCAAVSPTLADCEGDVAPSARQPSAPPAPTYPSVPPVAFQTQHPPSRPPSRRAHRVALLLAVSAISLVLGAAAALTLAARQTPRTLGRGLEHHDPAHATPLIRHRIERANMTVLEERHLGSSRVELGFVHPKLVGVMRLETFGSPSEARATLATLHDGGSVRIARGRRLLSIWASPRGQTGFDRATAERAQELLMGSLP